MINKSFSVIQYNFISLIWSTGLHFYILKLNVSGMAYISTPRRQYAEEELLRVPSNIFWNYAFVIFFGAGSQAMSADLSVYRMVLLTCSI